MNTQQQAEKARQLRAQGLVLAKSGDLNTAAAIFEQAIALDGTDAPVCQLLGIIYSEINEYAKSKEAFTKYLNLVKDNPRGYVNRGAINLKLNLFNEAIADYTRAVEMSPHNTDMIVWLANAYDTAGQFENAVRFYDKALTIDPGNARIYYERGLALKEQERFEEALADFEHVLRLEPDNKDALEMKRKMLIARHIIDPNAGTTNALEEEVMTLSRNALQQEAEGNFSAAIALYSKALEMVPDNAILWNNRGWTYYISGQLEAALADFSRAIQVEPNYVQAYTNRANVYNKMNCPEAALNDFTHVLRLDDRNAYNFYNMGATLQLLQRYPEAIEQFTTAIQLDSNDADYYIGRGLCNEALKRPNEALADFTQAVRINPGEPMSYFNRGNILYDLGRYETALKDFTKTLSLHPSFYMAYINRAATLEQLNQEEEAFQDLLKAVALNERHPFLHIKLGYHYIRKEDLVNARQHFMRAKEMGHPDAEEGLRELDGLI